ncbi:proto-oncogene serine/threonine-protein kinase mos [Ambystoma mexicanum]|uniref:proto-oncogene serine/threonine-protein kinase mos n=1 Tax=Ambystoma mexicanum TaxID=8296 RepID=UPI0037E983DE
MPSPIPLARFLPSVEIRSYNSSPLVLSCKRGPFASSPPVRERVLPPRLAWCSIDWGEVQILEPLGSGGFGHVYRATYRGETVAVKKVNRCVKNRLASRQSFWSELNAVQLPRHPNLVKVLAAGPCGPGDAEGLEAVIMEYAGSSTLHHAIYNCPGSDLGFARCLTYSRDLTRGLAFLHAHNIVHLDLKPANVLLARRGPHTCCKIGDFGCSLRLHLLDPGAATGLTGGTYTHRAPELLRGLPATRKADIFSFAITLWQMVSRRVPYEGVERQCVIYAVVAYQLRPTLSDPIFSAPNSLGACFRGTIERCWAAQPEERPGAKCLLEELDNIQDSENQAQERCSTPDLPVY